ncbi:hypothetical protein O7614_17325 [Micromonospora sp. WMMD961]|uniref:hypothetical protein n=1 Tax=Micromonospora sp. WMMD961 TaxID=3016100 RepID=UPI00241625F5|nr:hypothetical protein [Micromonospora sp. WMMD961]MDG4781415.1 hypothetical protein [Micromonospora sp. WMMD961]
MAVPGVGLIPGLPVTGTPIVAVAAAGILLVLIGVAARWHTRRIRWVVRKQVT